MKQGLSSKTWILLVVFLLLDSWLWFLVLRETPLTKELAVLDVGQGDATVLKINQAFFLVDAGEDGKTRRSFEKTYPGVHRLDLVFITHPQKDHYGGLMNLLERMEVGAVVMNGASTDSAGLVWKTLEEKLKEKSVPIIALERGDRVRYGEDLIEILSPSPAWRLSAEPNDASLVFMAKVNSAKLFFTGDIGTEVETELAALYDLRADFLKVPHHGSRFSSSLKFLEEVRPRLASISSGKNNSYGHPHREILERLELTGNPYLWRTDTSGTLRAMITPENIKLVSLKNQ